MNQYIRDEREIQNAYRFSPEMQKSIFDCCLFAFIRDKYASLNARTRHRLPSYIGIGIASILALSFFSAGLSYHSLAEQNNFSIEHT